MLKSEYLIVNRSDILDLLVNCTRREHEFNTRPLAFRDASLSTAQKGSQKQSMSQLPLSSETANSIPGQSNHPRKSQFLQFSNFLIRKSHSSESHERISQLDDPATSSTKPKSHHPGSHKHSHHQHRRPSVASLLQEIRSLSDRDDRLEYEIRRAQEAVARAEYAETRLKETFAKMTEAEEARSQSEIHSIKVEEDLRRHTEQLSRLQQELDDTRTKMANVQEEKSFSEIETERLKVENLELESKFRNYKAREKGRERVSRRAC